MSSQRAHGFLHGLLDRLEARPDRTNRLTETRLPPFPRADERDAFEAVLQDAAKAAAIGLEYGKRDRRHLIDRVVLTDSGALYRFLSRTPIKERAAAKAALLRESFVSARTEVHEAISHMETQWSAVRQGYGFSVDDLGVEGFLRCLQAVLDRAPDDRSDLRTYSRRTTGYSKLIEENAGPFAVWCRETGRCPATAEPEEVLVLFGLEKVSHPVLIAGPVHSGAIDVARVPYVGLPPEVLDGLMPTGPVDCLLTIENLASFNRHVREVDTRRHVVIYTGGFPSKAVVQAIRKAASWTLERFHWGDIDPSGIEIALYIQRSCSDLPGFLLPHLMSVEVAERLGSSKPPAKDINASGTAFAVLAQFLSSDNARHLEQEGLDPKPPRT